MEAKAVVHDYGRRTTVTFEWSEEELYPLVFDPIDLAVLREPVNSPADMAQNIHIIALKIEQAAAREGEE